MFINKSFGAIALLTTLFISNNMYAYIFNSEFVLKNNSAFNIKYKFANADESAQEFILPAGASITTKIQKISIRRSGVGSSYVSSWVNVPTINELRLKRENQNAFASEVEGRQKTPIISIGSGYTGGWTFTLEYPMYLTL